MTEVEPDLPEHGQPLEEKPSYFTQAGPLNDPSLSQLRDQIKKVMIPLLIKTFQLKLELSQSLSLPSRLHSSKNQRSLEEVQDQLKTLDGDLKVLLLWCQSCQTQIQKALKLPEEEQKNTVAAASSTAHPSVSKSFSEAVSAQSSFFKQNQGAEKEDAMFPEDADAYRRKKWWEKILGK